MTTNVCHCKKIKKVSLISSDVFIYCVQKHTHAYTHAHTHTCTQGSIMGSYGNSMLANSVTATNSLDNIIFTTHNSNQSVTLQRKTSMLKFQPFLKFMYKIMERKVCQNL